MSEMTLEEALSMVDGGPHHIGEWAQAATILSAEVRRLQAENARLRGETIGTIRRTADGKAVTFGGRVYHPACVNPAWSHEVKDPDAIDVPTKIGRDNFVCESIEVAVEKCYSTREAAEKGVGRG